MRVGIFSQHSNSWFENGCNQQSLFVYETLNNISNVDCSIITMKSDKLDNIKTVSLDENVNNILNFEVIIFLSNSLHQENILKDIKKSGIKIINYNCGNWYYIYQEDLIFNVHNKINNVSQYKFHDEYWSIPNYSKDKYFYETIYNLDFKTAPYVWNETIINKYKNINYEINKATSETKYILIAEPNVQITKTCLTPLLICERLYNNNLFKNIKVIVLSQRKNDSFKTFLEILNIYKEGLVETYDRLVFFDIIKQLKEKYIDFYILSHHQDNPLNFLHLETLHLGYPLIHNCDCYKNAGYFYNDINEGSNQLLTAINNHKNKIKEYKEESKKTIFKYSPNNPVNINNYKILLDNIINKDNIFSFVNNVIVCPTHGFGNRIRFINTVYQICKYFNKKLYILWKEEDNCNVKLEDIIIDIPGVEILKTDINSLDYLYLGFKHIKEIINNIPNKKYDYLLLSGGHEFKLDNININDFIKEKNIFYKNIRWSDKVLKLVNYYKNKYNLDKYVAVHYRGYSYKYDNLDIDENSEKDFEIINKIDKYNSLINKIKSEYKVILISNVINKRLNNDKLINLSNKTMNRDSSEDMINSIAEFILLSNSSLIIGSYTSSFSDEASFVNLVPKIMPCEINDINYHCYGITSINNIYGLNNDKQIFQDIFN